MRVTMGTSSPAKQLPPKQVEPRLPDQMLYKQPRRNSDHTATISKTKKKQLVWCQVCGQHRSSSPRTCIICKRKRALPSCRPQYCWIQFPGKKAGGCMQGLLQTPPLRCIPRNNGGAHRRVFREEGIRSCRAEEKRYPKI